MATLQTWVKSTRHGRGTAAGAIGYVFRIADLAGEAQMRQVVGPIALSIGPTNVGGQKLQLSAGRYFVRVRLPTGEELTDNVELLDDDSVVDWPLHGLTDVWARQLDASKTRLIDAVDRALERKPRSHSQAPSQTLTKLSVARKVCKKKAAKGSAAKKSRQGHRNIPRVGRLAPLDPTVGMLYRESGTALTSASYSGAGSALALESAPSRHALFVGTLVPREQPLPKSGSDSEAYRRFWTAGVIGRDQVLLTALETGALHAQLAPFHALHSSAVAPSLPLSLTSSGRRSVDSVAQSHRMFYWSKNGVVQRVGVVPLPWDRAGQRSLAEQSRLVFIGSQPSRIPEVTEQIGVSIDAPEIASLLGFLKSGNLVGAEALEGHAAGVLSDNAHPYATAAAGYFLTALAEARGEFTKGVPARMKQLRDVFPFVSDGSIQYGWSQLHMAARAIRRGPTPAVATRLQAARSSLIEAVRRGMPIYPQGVKLLSDGLMLIRGSEEGGLLPPLAGRRRSEDTDSALAAVRWLALRVDKREMFTVVSLDESSSDS